MLASVLHFYSGKPLQIHSGVDTLKLHRSIGFGEVSSEGPNQKTPVISGNPEDGTFVAISYLSLGVVAKLAKPAVSERAVRGAVASVAAGDHHRRQRGGHRNRADRESLSLTGGQIAHLTAAIMHAEKIGLPINRMMTIHWEAAGVPLEAMAKATGKFIDLLSKALLRHRCRTAWAFIHESGDGKGGHCHLLAHISPALVDLVSRRQRSWLRRITGKPYRSRVILSRPVGGRLGLELGNPDLHAANLVTAVDYVIKGADQEAAERFNLRRLEKGGRVIGKRCGTSQNIGQKARKEKHD